MRGVLVNDHSPDILAQVGRLDERAAGPASELA